MVLERSRRSRMSESLFMISPGAFTAYQNCTCKGSRMVDGTNFEQGPVEEDGKLKIKITTRPEYIEVRRKAARSNRRLAVEHDGVAKLYAENAQERIDREWQDELTDAFLAVSNSHRALANAFRNQAKQFESEAKSIDQ